MFLVDLFWIFRGSRETIMVMLFQMPYVVVLQKYVTYLRQNDRRALRLGTNLLVLVCFIFSLTFMLSTVYGAINEVPEASKYVWLSLGVLLLVILLGYYLRIKLNQFAPLPVKYDR